MKRLMMREDTTMRDLCDDYCGVLTALYRRREELWAQMGSCGRRLTVLDEEIDELEEAVMQMRPYWIRRADGR